VVSGECACRAVSARRRLRSTLDRGGWVRRKAHRDGQAAFGPGTDHEARSVGFGDFGDDGQAESETVWSGGPIHGGALEGLKQPAHLVWRYGGSGVGNGERRFRGGGCEPDLDTSAGDVVTDGVADEVRYQPVDEAGVP